MKLVTNKETTIKLLAEILSEYQILAEANPFAAAAEKADAGGGDAGAEEPAADAEGGGEEKAKDDKKAKPAEPAGLTVDFNISAVKKYNDAAFRSNKGEVKAINKNGLEVAVDNGQTIHINFQDITNE
jgi:hypothetical protein